MKLTLSILFYFLISISAYAADENVANKPTHHVGDVYEVADKVATVKCKRWEIKELNSNGNLIKTCGNYILYLSVDNDYNPVKITNKSGKVFTEFKPYFPALSFPLQVGKKWKGKYSGFTKDNGAKWNSNVNCEVKTIEDLTIAAGTFKSFRIDCIDKWSAGSFKGVGHSSRWYSSDLKKIIKVSHKEDSRWNMENTSYKIK